MNSFILLKRTYPVSKHDRCCDGYQYIFDNSSAVERKKWGIIDDELQSTIKEGEKYIYQVAKENNELKIMCLCFENYGIIRKHIYGIDDE